MSSRVASNPPRRSDGKNRKNAEIDESTIERLDERTCTPAKLRCLLENFYAKSPQTSRFGSSHPG
jgi:hypothetical protein